jgi:c-di-GMP-related signal transduction protein
MRAEVAKNPLLLSAIKKVYVARQPIFDRKENVVAYELLFRTGFDNFYDTLNDGDYASSKTIMNSFVTLGMDVLTGGKPAFINFTKNLLIDETATMFPRELLAVEILENIEPDDEIVEACKKIKKQGYLLALDDFSLRPGILPLVDVVDIIKIDYRSSILSERMNVMSALGKDRIKYLAEKVETHEEFDEAKGMGFTFFQGYFFSRPHIIEGREIHGFKLNYLHILREINEPDVEFDMLEHIVKRDMSLTYKLLKFINSATFSFQAKIKSIRQALTMLGLVEFKKWVSLLVLSEMGNDKPQELMLNSMLRAKFCEFLAAKVKMHDDCADMFLLGMFSSIDAFIDRPMHDIVAELPLSDMIKDALCGKNNKFREILDIVIAYEKGDWSEWSRLLSMFKINEFEFPEIYLNSMEWVQKIFMK